MSRLPNLFLIGAKKSATSSLWDYIRTHPQIYAPEAKEPCFFHDTRFCKDLEDYLNLYKDARNQTYLLDASPQYTIDPNSKNAARRIFEFNSQAKIIYILRDPYARMVSDYLFCVWIGRESRDALKVFNQESIYSRTSYYAEQLKPYWELFGAGSIYIDTFEALVSNPQDFCKRLFAWLEIDSNFVPANLGEHLMQTPAKVSLFDEASLSVKLWRFLRSYRSLPAYFPMWFRLWAREFRPVRKVVDARSQEFSRDKEEIRRLWADRIRSSIAELEELTGKEFREWPSRSWLNPVVVERPGELLGAIPLTPAQDTWSESPEDSA